MINLPDWLVLSPHGITADDYEALSEEICRRIEIVDGAVLMNTAPSRSHQTILVNLAVLLEKNCGDEWALTHNTDFRLREVTLLNRRPDIVLYAADLPDDEVLRPCHCLLVAEIMSPGSMTADQLHKPAEYAAAGVEHFWRVENPDDTGENLSIFRYQLKPGAREYTLIGSDTGKMSITDPFPVTIDDFNDLFW